MGVSTVYQPKNIFDINTFTLSLVPTSKTTVIDDPTAGMTQEEITNYMSNVGGNLCGLPEVMKTIIGLGLNLSLITFGLFVVSYIVLGGLNFAYEKQVDDAIEDNSDPKAINVGDKFGDDSNLTQKLNREDRRRKQRLAEKKKD